MPLPEPDGTLRVRESLAALVRSPQMKGLLQRFKDRLESMELGVQLQESRVTFASGRCIESEAVAGLLEGHILKTLSVETSFDSENMKKAMELASVLHGMKAEFFATDAFLSALMQMLQNSKNADDLKALATICLEHFSSQGANLRLASTAEVAHPEIIIEMSKANVQLQLSVRGVRPPADVPANVRSASEAPAEIPLPPPQPEILAPQHGPEEEKPQLTLMEKLRSAGLNDSFAADVLKASGDEAAASEAFDSLSERFGAGILAMVLCRNKLALHRDEAVIRTLEGFAKASANVGADSSVSESYCSLSEALQKAMGAAPAQCNVIIDALAYRNVGSEEAIRNLEILLSRMPSETAKVLILGNPAFLGRKRDIQASVARAQPVRQEESVDPAPAPAPVPARKSSVTPMEPLEALTAKLEEIGAGKGMVELIAGSAIYSLSAEQCLRNLEKFIRKHGEALALLAVYKNRAMLIGNSGPALDSIIADVRAVRKDAELREKFGRVLKLLSSELNLPEESIYPLLKTNKLTEAMLLENLRLLLSRVPKEDLRVIVLSGPSKLSMEAGVHRILAEYPAEASKAASAKEIDALAEKIAKALEGKRSAVFVRNYVIDNAANLSNMSLEAAVRKAEYKARVLIKLATEKGIDGDFSASCVEKGMITLEEILSAHGDYEALKGLDAEKALPILVAKLAELGVEKSYAEEVLSNAAYREKADRCLANLLDIIRQYGPGTALIIIHKNRTCLIGKEGSAVVGEILEDIRRVRNEPGTLEKYHELKTLLVDGVGLPEEAAFVVIAKLRGTQSRLIEDLNVLLAHLHKETVRTLLLKSPHVLVSRSAIEQALAESTVGSAIDIEQVIARILKSGNGKRPAPFVRSLVSANLLIFAHQTPERAWRNVEFTARMLIGLAKKNGIGAEFAADCIARGMVSIEEMRAAKEAARAAPAPIAAPPEKAEPTDEIPAVPQAAAAPEPQPAPGAPDPLAVGQVSEVPDAMPVSERLGEQLISLRMDPKMIIRILSKSEEREIGEMVLTRLEVAADLIRGCMPQHMDVGGCMRGFLESNSNVDKLLDASSDAFNSAVTDFAGDLFNHPAHAGRGAQNGRNGDRIKHIRIASNDIELFTLIQGVPVAEDVKAFLESRNLDPHEFAYVALKIFGWLRNGDFNSPKKLKWDDYGRNVAEFANGAAKNVNSVLNRLVDDIARRNVRLKSEGELKDFAREIRAFLKDVKAELSR